MPRAVKEWVGKTDDSMPSAKVRQRIYDRENGTCYLCKGEITPGQGFHLDHKHELKDGGENKEGNLFPVHPKCHRHKSAQKAMERAPIERKRQKHSGAKRSKASIQSAPFPKTEKTGRVSKQELPPKRLYQEV